MKRQFTFIGEFGVCVGSWVQRENTKKNERFQHRMTRSVAAVNALNVIIGIGPADQCAHSVWSTNLARFNLAKNLPRGSNIFRIARGCEITSLIDITNDIRIACNK